MIQGSLKAGQLIKPWGDIIYLGGDELCKLTSETLPVINAMSEGYQGA